MDIATVRTFFMWCTIMSGGLLLLSFLIIAFAGDWVYRMHRKWFPLSRESFYGVIYAFLGVLKLFVLIFNLIPYMALLLVK